MRRFVAFALTLLLAVPPLGPAFADNDDESKRHFRAGVALYQGGNYRGALAEFQASQHLRPTASALQNIALCQKGLFRYLEAIATLESLQREFGDKLSQPEKKAVRDAIDEMRPLVATVAVAVSPPNAVLSIDGRAVPGGAERRVQLDVGEHAFEAEAPGFKPYAKRISFASADRRIEVALTPELGVLSVRADDAEATIAVDGVERGKGAWSGNVSAGVKHVVTASKPGKKTATLEALVGAGERQELAAKLEESAAPSPYVQAPTSPDRQQHQGFYGHLMASSYFVSGHPDNFAVPKGDRVTLDGAYFGFRAGYRLTNLFGLEGSFEFGRHNVGPGCYNQNVNGSTDCNDEQAKTDDQTYFLAGRRLGVNGRLFFPTSPFTLVAAFGIGTVNHEFRIDASKDGLSAVKANAWNGYAMFEGGAEFNVRRVLIDVVLVVVGEGVNNLRSDQADERQAYKGTPNIAMLGLGLRLGYGLF